MGTITGLTAERMQEIIDKTLNGASIVSNRLILALRDGSTIDAGSVVATTPPLVSTPAALAALETFDGREAYYTAASGLRWHLRYDTGLDRWDVISGPPLVARNDGDISTTNAQNTYLDMTDAGPSITLPLNGNYEVYVGCEIEIPVVATDHAGFMNFRRSTDAVPLTDIDSARLQARGAGNTGAIGTVISPPTVKAYNANDLIEAVYRDGSALNSVTFRKRWMRITPKQVST